MARWARGGGPTTSSTPGRSPRPTAGDQGGEDERSLGGRIVGGSSAVNACMVLRGSPADYDEWGTGWTYDELAPFLDRAEAELRTAPANTVRPAPFHRAFLEAARTVDADATPFPANVVDGTRWNAALAYLEPARARENLEIVDEALVDRVVLDGPGATGVICADGRMFEAKTVILTAGAYFSPAILLRSGIGPGLAVDLPVGDASPRPPRNVDGVGADGATPG